MLQCVVHDETVEICTNTAEQVRSTSSSQKRLPQPETERRRKMEPDAGEESFRQEEEEVAAPEDVGPGSRGGDPHLQLPVKPPGSPESRVQRVRPVGGRYHHHPWTPCCTHT